MKKQLNLCGSFLYKNESHNVYLEKPKHNVWVSKSINENLQLESIGETAKDELEAYTKVLKCYDSISTSERVEVISFPL
jgi:hypothetical protein